METSARYVGLDELGALSDDELADRADRAMQREAARRAVVFQAVRRDGLSAMREAIKSLLDDSDRDEDPSSDYESTHTWLQDAESLHEGLKGVDLAEALVRDFIAASDDLLYSYDCSFNPEGLPRKHFIEREMRAEHRMMAALSVLDEEALSRVLTVAQQRDFDGSSFPVSNVDRVNAWREQNAGRSIADVLSDGSFTPPSSSPSPRC